MSNDKLTHILTTAVERLSAPEYLSGLCHNQNNGNPLPSGHMLEEIVELARAIIFPGYYGNPSINSETVRYHIGVDVERLHRLLSEQILAGLCFSGDGLNHEDSITTLAEKSADISAHLIDRLPHIRSMLADDVTAAYNGDPAAVSKSEIISCYPVIKTLVNYRIAHELHLLGVPLIPRMLTEMSHSETGIDIHPAATIGRFFTIDHGTGVVIGATCIIGDNVKLYQGVTLGARSFPLDSDGNPIKGIPRHPILEDNVIVYSNATILGRITIGHDSVIGGNVWVSHGVPPYSSISQSKPMEQAFTDGAGI